MSAVEGRPAQLVAQSLVVEHEFSDFVGELGALPTALQPAGLHAVVCSRCCPRRLDRVRGGSQFVGRHMAHCRGLAGSVRSMPGCTTQVSRRGVGVAGRGAGFCPRDLTPRPGTSEVDCPTWTIVLRPGLFEVVQDVLRAVSRPHRETTMIVVLEGPAATRGDEPRIPDLGKNHRLAHPAVVSVTAPSLSSRFSTAEIITRRMADDTSTPDVDRPDVPWRLDGRLALVTGASSGLGARFARVLHQAGANVLVTARRGDRLHELAAECGERIETMTGDITDPRHRQALAEHLRSRGRLDVLVNNAGICDDGPIEEQSLDDLRQVIEVNLISVMDLCRLTAPLLLASPVASVINIASIYGVVASRGPMAAYNAAKGAVVNLTRQLAAQWGSRGVRVNALAPGYFPSEMTGFLADEDFAQSIRERTLLGRTPVVEEIDGPLLFLASDVSSYITGHILLVDGGWTAI